MEFNCMYDYKGNKKIKFDYGFTNGNDLRIEMMYSEEPLIYITKEESIKLAKYILEKADK